MLLNLLKSKELRGNSMSLSLVNVDQSSFRSVLNSDVFSIGQFLFYSIFWLFFFFLEGGRHPEMLRYYFWRCNQELYLEGWRTRWGARGWNWSTICKTKTFPIVLSLELLLHFLGNEFLKSASFVLSLCSAENISALGLIFHCQSSVLLL